MTGFYFQPESGGGAASDARRRPPVLFRFKPPAGGFTAPVAHVFPVQVHAVLEFHAVSGHTPQHFCLISWRQSRKAIFPRRQQTLPEKPSLLRREALLALQQFTDGVVHHERRMGQRIPLPAPQMRHKGIIFIQGHPVRVGEHIHLPDLPRRVVADVHRRAHRQHRGPLPLAGIGCRRQLGITEGIQHPVVADPVAGAEVLVSGIVEHTPAETPRVLLHRRVLHPYVAQSLLLPLLPGVEWLGGEHMAVALGDKAGLVHIRRDRLFGSRAGRLSIVGEVVVSVHVLQQMAFFQIPHAGGRAAGVQLAGDGVGAGVEFIIVLAFVDAHAPQHDGRVVPVLQNHLPDVFACLLLPRLIPDVLPTWNLGKHQQSQPVALIYKVLALRIVAGTDGVAAQFRL